MNSKNIITASFLIIALSIAYYFVIFLPTQERNKQMLQDEKTTLEQQSLEKSKQISTDCEKSAGEQATETLKSKAELMPAGQTKTMYEEAVAKNMYLKDDYKELFESCLKRNGVSQ